MLIMFFKGNAFREFVMPNTDNTNYSIVLDKELFGLSEDVLDNLLMNLELTVRSSSVGICGNVASKP